MHEKALLFVCCVAIALISIPVGADQKPVQTNRVEALELTSPEEKDVFQFVIFGDRTGGPVEGIEVLRETVRGTNLLDPDFVMTAGATLTMSRLTLLFPWHVTRKPKAPGRPARSLPPLRPAFERWAR